MVADVAGEGAKRAAYQLGNAVGMVTCPAPVDEVT
jgi:hypothetical protein